MCAVKLNEIVKYSSVCSVYKCGGMGRKCLQIKFESLCAFVYKYHILLILKLDKIELAERLFTNYS